MPTQDTKRYLLLLTVAAALGACGDKDSQTASNQSARQIELPPAPAAQPQLNDVAKPEPPAAKPEPEKKKPVEKKAPAPQPAEPRTVTVLQVPQPAPANAPANAPAAMAPAEKPAQVFGVITTGSTLSVSPVARLCTDLYREGDRVTATLDASVQGVDGAMLPMGSTVMLRVVSATRGVGSEADAKITLEPVSVRIGDSTYAIGAHLASQPPVQVTRQQSTGDQAKKVGAGAVIGALAGQLLGKNTKSTVAGAAVGAAAGAAVAAGTASYDACIVPGAHIQVLLDRPLTVKILGRQ